MVISRLEILAHLLKDSSWCYMFINALFKFKNVDPNVTFETVKNIMKNRRMLEM